MGNAMTDSFLFKDVFGDVEMMKIWDDRNWLQKWLDVEVALAEAEAEIGVVPQKAADEIGRRANMAILHHEKIKERFDQLGHPLMALIKVLQEVCEDGAGEFIHWGATTQDIMDTALVLQIKESLIIIDRELSSILTILKELAKVHRDTIMVGRTHGQQALPITFGFKVVVWCKELQRHKERLVECRKRALAGQLSGAVGTMASFGKKGFEIQHIMMKKLGLDVPDITWHSARDRVSEIINILNMISSSFGKIAKEIILLQKNEFDELEESSMVEKISSSTMPHKKNPSTCETVVALSKMIQALSCLSSEIMRPEHERDNILLKCEWMLLPQFFVMFGAIMKHSSKVLYGLKINKEQMKKNLEITGGLILSEQVMLQLSKKLGRQKSHEIVKNLAKKSLRENISFEEVLSNDPQILEYVTKGEIKELINPYSYTGLSSLFVDKIVAELDSSGY